MNSAVQFSMNLPKGGGSQLVGLFLIPFKLRMSVQGNALECCNRKQPTRKQVVRG